jgi:plastocyanin
MDTSLNSQIISFTLLILLAVIMPKAHSENSCNTKSVDNSCVQVFVNNKNGQALADMVVYLEPLEGQKLEQSSKKVVVNQSGKSFSPYISVSQVNSEVDFVNQDDITHHIYSAGSDNKFSFKIRSGQTNTLAQFNQEAEVAMGCNIHDWMSGHLLVVNTPYFTKTNAQGQASFDVASNGKYKIVVWHPQLQSENNRLIKEEAILNNSVFSFTLQNEMSESPLQESDDDFDFLSDY